MDIVEQATFSGPTRTTSNERSSTGRGVLRPKQNSVDRHQLPSLGLDIFPTGPLEPVRPLFGMSSFRPAARNSLDSGSLPEGICLDLPSSLSSLPRACSLPQSSSDVVTFPTRSKWTPAVGGLRKLDPKEELRPDTLPTSITSQPRQDVATADLLQQTLRNAQRCGERPCGMPDKELVSQILSGGEEQVWGMILLLRSLEAEVKQANEEKATLEREKEEMSRKVERMQKELRRNGNSWVQPQVQKFENQVIMLTGRVLQLQERIKQMSLDKSENSDRPEKTGKEEEQNTEMPPPPNKPKGAPLTQVNGFCQGNGRGASLFQRSHNLGATQRSGSSSQDASGDSRRVDAGVSRGSEDDRQSSENANRKRLREDWSEAVLGITAGMGGTHLKVDEGVNLLPEVSKVQCSLKAAIGLAQKLATVVHAHPDAEDALGVEGQSGAALTLQMMDHFAQTELRLARLGALVCDGFS